MKCEIYTRRSKSLVNNMLEVKHHGHKLVESSVVVLELELRSFTNRDYLRKVLFISSKPRVFKEHTRIVELLIKPIKKKTKKHYTLGKLWVDITFG